MHATPVISLRNTGSGQSDEERHRRRAACLPATCVPSKRPRHTHDSNFPQQQMRTGSTGSNRTCTPMKNGPPKSERVTKPGPRPATRLGRTRAPIATSTCNTPPSPRPSRKTPCRTERAEVAHTGDGRGATAQQMPLRPLHLGTSMEGGGGTKYGERKNRNTSGRHTQINSEDTTLLLQVAGCASRPTCSPPRCRRSFV